MVRKKRVLENTMKITQNGNLLHFTKRYLVLWPTIDDQQGRRSWISDFILINKFIHQSIHHNFGTLPGIVMHISIILAVDIRLPKTLSSFSCLYDHQYSCPVNKLQQNMLAIFLMKWNSTSIYVQWKKQLLQNQVVE